VIHSGSFIGRQGAGVDIRKKVLVIRFASTPTWRQGRNLAQMHGQRQFALNARFTACLGVRSIIEVVRPLFICRAMRVCR